MASATRSSVAEHGYRVTLGLFEQQRRPVRGKNASANLGHLEMGIDLRSDALEKMAAFELGEKIAKISVFHGNVLASYLFLREICKFR
jgi:hypothetical protein